MKTENKILVFAMLFVVVSLLIAICYLYPFFDVTPQLIKQIPIESKIIEIYSIEGNATMQDCIQIKLVDERKCTFFSNSYEGYNYLMKYSYSNGTLKIILKDTTLQNSVRQDTFLLNIKELL